jgi:signal transduction histidine kinase
MEVHMSRLALASRNSSHGSSERWAHDIRNALATVGLHVETLERLSGSRGRDIAQAAHMLMSRAAAMCNEAMAQGAQPEAPSSHRPFDVTQTIVQIANLLRPIAPPDFEIRVAGSGSCVVLAEHQEVFRILFNLVHNAITVARQPAAPMTNVTILVERNAATVTVRIADDGPGLPETVRANLFRRQQSTTGGSGIGLSIARELAERNGGMLRYAETAGGTAFVLELIGHASGSGAEGGALRSLGKRVQH